MLGLNLALGVASPGQRSLLQRALSAIRRNGGTLIGIPDNFAGAYIDSAGTMPVTAVGDVLGLLTDRSYGAGNLGAELVTVPSISLSALSLGIGPALVAGKAYQVGFTVSNYTGTGDCGFDAPTFTALSGATRLRGNGTARGIVVAAGGPTIGLFTRTTNSATFSEISVREVLGNHATQPTTASKPTVTRVPKRTKGPVNQLLWSGDFSNAAWTKQVGATVGAVTADPDGGNAAVIVSLPSAGAVVRCDNMAWTGGSTGTVACWVRKSTTGGANAIRLTTNNSAAWNTGISQKATLTSSWQLVVMSGVLTSTGTLISVLIGGMTETAGSDADCVGNVDIYRAALFTGTVTAQQILDNGGIPLTTTQPLPNVLEWTNAISFDGSNDFLQTGITTGNEGWICAGVTFGGAAGANETVFEAGAVAAATNKGVWLFRWGGAGVNWLEMRVGNGATVTTKGVSTIPLLGVPRVVEGGWDASTVLVGVDGVISTKTRTGDASPSGTPLRIGAYQGGENFLQGGMSVQVICPVLPSAADRALIRKWIGSLQGQTL